MKKVKKSWVIGGGLLLLIAAAVVFSITRPMSVPVAETAAKDVSLFFTEEGFVEDETSIDIYSLHAGAVTALYVKENQAVKKNDPLCVIDSSKLLFDLETAKSTQNGYLSQINDLDLKEKQTKDELRINRDKLQGDYNTVLADERTSGQSYMSSEAIKEEQLSMQNIIIEQNRADLRTAKDNLQKSETLFAAGVISKQEAYDNRAEADRLEGELEQNIRKLEIIKSGSEVLSRDEYYKSAKTSLLSQISGIDTQLGNTYTDAMKDYYKSLIESGEASIRLLEKQIEECTVKAPADGVVTKLNIDNSNVAATDMPIATISTGFEALIEVYVPTSEIGSVNLGDTVQLELKSNAETAYNGVITEIDNKAEIRTSSLGVEKRKVKVTIEPVPEHVEYFNPGYDLTATFTTYKEEDVITVPRTALTYIGEKPAVWVVADGKAQVREITVGRELKTEYVVSSGLSAGEQVIKDATAPGLENGKRVTGVI